MNHKFFGILGIILLLSACQDEKETPEKPLRFDQETIVKKAGENCDTADYDCAVISLEILKAKGPEEIASRINNSLEAHVIKLISSEENPQAKDLKELTNTFISDYQKAAESFSEEPPWEAYVNQSIYLQDHKMISIGITTEIFSGGAHGYKNLTFLNFDPSSGKTYSWRNIFKPEFKDLVEEKFRGKQGIPPEDNINSTGFWFENDVFHLPVNIGFSDDKVILIYNSYEIAPYASGDFLLELSRDEVEPFLKIQ